MQIPLAFVTSGHRLLETAHGSGFKTEFWLNDKSKPKLFQVSDYLNHKADLIFLC